MLKRFEYGKFFLFGSLSLLSVLLFQVKAQGERKSLVCYYDSTSYWREDIGSFKVGDIDPNLCTHLIYSYMGLSERTNRIYSRDPGLDLGPGEVESDPSDPGNNKGDKDNIRKTAQLRNGEDGNPDLKVLISIGGKDQNSRTFSNMARHIANRTLFINSTIDFVVKYNLDGIDLDWRYPSLGDGRPEDKEDLVSVFKEMREAFNILSEKTGRTYFLTGAFGCRKEIIEKGYNLPELAKFVNIFHLMCFDMKFFTTESDGKLIGHHSPLHPKSTDALESQQLNAEFGVNLFLSSGVPASKLLLGVSTHARTYEISEDKYNFYDEAIGPGGAGPFTLQAGFLSYYEICLELKDNLNKWQILYDYDYQIPYGFNSTMWLGFDNEISAQEKVDFAIQNGLGGMMVQFIDLDDCKKYMPRLASMPNHCSP